MSSLPQRKSGKGRKKVKIQKIEDQKKRAVTFSKRYDGIFNKTNELSTLTGAEAGVIVFSETNKAYSFGQPNVNTIINRLTNQAPPYDPNAPPRNQVVGESSNAQYINAVSNIEAIKKRGHELDSILEAPQMKPLFDATQALNDQEFNEMSGVARNFEHILDSYYGGNA